MPYFLSSHFAPVSQEIQQLQQKQQSYVREISDLQETIEWKDKKIGVGLSTPEMCSEWHCRSSADPAFAIPNYPMNNILLSDPAWCDWLSILPVNEQIAHFVFVQRYKIQEKLSSCTEFET